MDESGHLGLCDAASAALFYAHCDPRVTGLVSLNPWVRTEQGEARTYLKHYYVTRLVTRGFWGKVLSGRFDYSKAIRSLTQAITRASRTQNQQRRTGRTYRQRWILVIPPLCPIACLMDLAVLAEEPSSSLAATT